MESRDVNCFFWVIEESLPKFFDGRKKLDNTGGKEMPRFNKNNTQELKELLYNSCVHDAKLEKVEYKCGEDSIKIELFNPIFNVKMVLTFQNIEPALAIKGKEHGSSETIISLTVEEDFSYLQTYLPKHCECMESSLYLLFQMFSGEELHIVSKEVVVEIIS